MKDGVSKCEVCGKKVDIPSKDLRLLSVGDDEDKTCRPCWKILAEEFRFLVNGVRQLHKQEPKQYRNYQRTGRD